jgi:hypothetical protein
MSIEDIFVVGNSWSIPSNEAPNPAFNLLNLTNRWEHPGITLDAQSEYIISNKLVKGFKVIWLIGHHHRADPKGNGDYLTPYDWGEGNIWGKMTRDIWFKKFTKMPWYWRTNALFIKAALEGFTPDNLLLIPIYRPNILEHEFLQDNSCIWWEYMRDYTKDYPDGRGHMNQVGHTIFAIKLQEEIKSRWKISLTVTG